jgi:hypothetical protein
VADDPLGNLPPHDPAPRDPQPGTVTFESAGSRPLTCEFCECRLTPRGHALELSAKAKKWRDHSDDVAKLERRIAELEETVREKDRQIAAKPVKKSVFD